MSARFWACCTLGHPRLFAPDGTARNVAVIAGSMQEEIAWGRCDGRGHGTEIGALDAPTTYRRFGAGGMKKSHTILGA